MGKAKKTKSHCLYYFTTKDAFRSYVTTKHFTFGDKEKVLHTPHIKNGRSEDCEMWDFVSFFVSFYNGALGDWEFGKIQMKDRYSSHLILVMGY